MGGRWLACIVAAAWAGCAVELDYGGTAFRCVGGVCPGGFTCVNGECLAQAAPDGAAPADGRPDGFRGCGDEVCEPTGGESCQSCPGDCGDCPPGCGDTQCSLDDGEDCATCPDD